MTRTGRSLGVALFGGALLAGASIALEARAPVQWDCQIDLHQGDRGTLTLEMREDESFQGKLIVEPGRGGRSIVAGTWQRNTIRFRHATPGRRAEAFVGMSIGAPDGTVRMAGRFGETFDGVWSASCGRTAEAEPAPGGNTPAPAEPAPTPAEPPAPAEPAEPPAPAPPSASCSIAGVATGPRADVAKVFGVMLLGPNNDKRLRARQAFGTGRYAFSNLPDGRYVVVPDTKADVAVEVIPRRREVVCQGGAITDANFEFR